MDIRWLSTIFSWYSPAFRRPASHFCRARKWCLYSGRRRRPILETSAPCRTSWLIWPRTRERCFQSHSIFHRWIDARPGCYRRDEEKCPNCYAFLCAFAANYLDAYSFSSGSLSPPTRMSYPWRKKKLQKEHCRSFNFNNGISGNASERQKWIDILIIFKHQKHEFLLACYVAKKDSILRW